MTLDLSQLNSQQRDAVTSTALTTIVLAGPGSGKTRVLTQRIAWLIEQGVLPGHILAVTFTNKAAGEMKDRLAHLLSPEAAKQVTAKTFHSFGSWFLRKEMPGLSPYLAREALPVEGRELLGKFGGCRLDSHFLIYDADDGTALLREVVGDVLNLDTKRFAGPIEAYIEARKTEGALPSDPLLDQEAVNQPEMANYLQAYIHYQARLMARNAVDFQDLLLYPLQFLKSDTAGLQRWQDRFPHILVDESQDTNAVQFALLSLLAPAGRRPSCLPSGVPEVSLTVVGDEDQAIYEWRGADYHNLQALMASRKAESKVVLLTRNYRSGEVIVAAVNKLIARNADRTDKVLQAHNEGGQVEVIRAWSEADEAAVVADLIEDAIGQHGIGPSQIAVLYRRHALSRAIETAMVRRRIRYNLVKGQAFFTRKEIRDILAYLKLIISGDPVAFSRIANRPSRGIGAQTQAAILAAAENENLLEWILRYHQSGLNLNGAKPAVWKALASRHGLNLPAGAAQRVWEVSGLFAGLHFGIEGQTLTDLLLQIIRILQPDWAKADGDFEERVENAMELLTVAAPIEATGREGLTQFLDEIALVTLGDDVEADQDAVTLGTFHAAKGLEWKLVFVIAAEDTICPHQRSVEEGRMEEERRLFYVACTRAQEHLFITHAQCRTLYGSTDFNDPSPFIRELEQARG